MITIFNCMKNTYQFSVRQTIILWDFIGQYSNTPDGKWLKEVDHKSFTYLWKMDLEGGDIQAIRPFIGKAIILQPQNGNPDYWVKVIAPAVIHELRHVWQQKSKGWLLYKLQVAGSRIMHLFSNELYQKYDLEEDAFYHQEKSKILLGNI
ncbi:MAG: hypothetical protein J6W00_10860 [Lentisphaeria bacterium]|nr:hypothetical protein [Lentisphaeria bacterium]